MSRYLAVKLVMLILALAVVAMVFGTDPWGPA